MNMGIGLGIVLLLCTSVTTGCWDMTEPNQRALWVGSALDRSPKGRIEFTAQILSPRTLGDRGEAKGRQDIVKTGIGSSVYEAMHDVQEQISRRIYVAHREALFVGERMARGGLKEWLDELGRNPISNLRADIFVVKGQDGRDFLDEPAALEGYATKVARQAVQVSDVDERAITMGAFSSMCVSEGTRPFAQVIERYSDPKSGQSGNNDSAKLPKLNYNVRDIALFNRDVKMVGYLEGHEADSAIWVAGALRKTTITTFMPKGNGTVTLDFQRVSRHLRSVIHGGQITIYVTLSGTGLIRENNSSLDLSKSEILRYVEREFDRSTEQLAKRVIAKVQKEYGTDIFGFGEDIRRRHPSQWIRLNLKNNWDDDFSRVRVVVIARLIVRQFGEKGPSYILPGREP